MSRSRKRAASCPAFTVARMAGPPALAMVLLVVAPATAQQNPADRAARLAAEEHEQASTTRGMLATLGAVPDTAEHEEFGVTAWGFYAVDRFKAPTKSYRHISYCGMDSTRRLTPDFERQRVSVSDTTSDVQLTVTPGSLVVEFGGRDEPYIIVTDEPVKLPSGVTVFPVTPTGTPQAVVTHPRTVLSYFQRTGQRLKPVAALVCKPIAGTSRYGDCQPPAPALFPGDTPIEITAADASAMATRLASQCQTIANQHVAEIGKAVISLSARAETVQIVERPYRLAFGLDPIPLADPALGAENRIGARPQAPTQLRGTHAKP